jgi:dolichol-phosphate mannosyltransferase
LHFAKSGILAFSVKPLKYIGYLGILLIAFSILLIVYFGIKSIIFGIWLLSPTFTFTILNTFLMGLSLVSLGIIALYVSNIYYEVLDRPLYVISDRTFGDEQ